MEESSSEVITMKIFFVKAQRSDITSVGKWLKPKCQVRPYNTENSLLDFYQEYIQQKHQTRCVQQYSFHLFSIVLSLFSFFNIFFIMSVAFSDCMHPDIFFLLPFLYHFMQSCDVDVLQFFDLCALPVESLTFGLLAFF